MLSATLAAALVVHLGHASQPIYDFKKLRTAFTTEHRFSLQSKRSSTPVSRPKRALTSAEAAQIGERIPAPESIAGGLPWAGIDGWRRAVTADSKELGSLLRSNDDGVRFAAISEVAFRGLREHAPSLVELASQGWGPAAFALDHVAPGSTAVAAKLVRSPHAGVRLWAGVTLVKAGDKRGRATVWQELQAISGMGSYPGEITSVDVARSLLPFEKNDPEKLLQLLDLSRTHRFVQFIARLETKAARMALLKTAKEHRYHGHRHWAVVALATMKMNRSLLQEVAQSGLSKEFAKAALQKLEQGERPVMDMNHYRWVAGK
jgi:hypothetical protein